MLGFQTSERETKMSPAVLLGLVVVLAASVLRGLQQERLMKGTWGAEVAYYPSSIFVVLASQVFTLAGIVVCRPGELLQAARASPELFRLSRNEAYRLAVLGAVATLATIAQLEALKYVSFVTVALSRQSVLLLWQWTVAAFQHDRSLTSIAGLFVVLGGFMTYLASRPSSDNRVKAVSEGLTGALLILLSGAAELYHSAQVRAAERDEATSEVEKRRHTILLAGFAVVASTSYALLSIAFGGAAGSLVQLASSPGLSRCFWTLAGATAVAAVALRLLERTLSDVALSAIGLVLTVVSLTVNAVKFTRWTEVGVEGWLGIMWILSGFLVYVSPLLERGGTGGYRRVSFTSDLSSQRSSRSRRDEEKEADELPTFISSAPVARADAWWKVCAIVSCALAIPAAVATLLQISFPELSAVVMQPEFSSSAVQDATGAQVEGESWSVQLHEALAPACNNLSSETIPWDGLTKTALASYPRSGNTFLREMTERATGYQTSTLGYCDQSLATTFHGECDFDARLMVKTHYPTDEVDVDTGFFRKHEFDQVVHLIRNPIDAVFSGWNHGHVPKTASGSIDHSARLDIDALGSTAAQRKEVLTRASQWARHASFWESSPLPTHVLRYEDLMDYRLPKMMSLLTFLLPDSLDEVTLEDMACMSELDESKEAYRSRKAPAFDSWKSWDPDVRTELIETVKDSWCRYGYDRLLRAAIGVDSGVDNLCE